MSQLTRFLEDASVKVDAAEDRWVESRSGQRLLAFLSIGALGIFFQFGLRFAPLFVVACDFCLFLIAFRQIRSSDEPLSRALAATLAFSGAQHFFTYGTTASLRPFEFLFVLVALCYWVFIAIAPFRYSRAA